MVLSPWVGGQTPYSLTQHCYEMRPHSPSALCPWSVLHPVLSLQGKLCLSPTLRAPRLPWVPSLWTLSTHLSLDPGDTNTEYQQATSQGLRSAVGSIPRPT